MLIVAFSMAAIVNSYVVCARESDRSAYSLSAQSLALGRMEQVRAAKWDLVVSPLVDDVTNTPPVREGAGSAAPKQNRFCNQLHLHFFRYDQPAFETNPGRLCLALDEQ